MNTRWISCLLALASWTAPLTADVLDDAGVKLEDLLARRGAESRFGAQGRPSEPLAGIALSPEHEAEIRMRPMAERPDLDRVVLQAGLLEGRGDFAKGLEILRLGGDSRNPLDEIRLLLRMGKGDEAEAVAAAMARTPKPGKPSASAFRAQVIAGCRPLEDVEQWDLLASYLGILRKHLTAPYQQAGIWLEELDIAWHRGRLEEMKAAAGEDKLRLCLYYRQLGEVEASERLAAEMAADRMRLFELMDILPASNAVRAAAFARWQDKDLAVAERRQLWEAFSPRLASPGFNQVFFAWLAGGGDPAPFADLIAASWASGPVNNQVSDPLVLLELLQRRLPDDLGIRFLLARQVMQNDPERATTLFESLVTPRLRANWRVALHRIYPVDLQSPREALKEDPAMLGFAGLASMNRQDKVKAIIDRNPAWAGLPAQDRARYLAAGKMDHDLVALVLGADHSLPENDGLGEWLGTVIDQRSNERTIPPELYPEIARQLPELALGMPAKEAASIASDAGKLAVLLGNSPMEVAEIRAAVRRLGEAAGARSGELKEAVALRIAADTSRIPRLKGVFPYPPGKEPKVTPSGTGGIAGEVNAYLTLLLPPRIQRLGSNASVADRGMQAGLFQPQPRYATPQALARWGDSIPQERNRWYERPELLGGLLKEFPAGHPRRIMPELFIAMELVPCPDPELKARCTNSVEDLVSGKLALRGTELFRYLTLSQRNAGDEVLLAILEEVKKLPPGGRAEFLSGVSLDRRGKAQNLARLVLAKQAESPQGGGRQQPDPDQQKLNELANSGLGASPEAQRLARVLLDRSIDRVLDAATSPQVVEGPQRRRPGFSVGEVSMALRTLEQAALLDGWLEDAGGKLRAGGLPEVQILRILQQYEQGRSRSDEKRYGDYARRIFDLDPADQESARVVLGIALSERDREMVMKCLGSLGLRGFDRDQGQALMSLFAGGQEGALMDVIEGVDFARNYPDQRLAELLHGYFLAADKALAKRFRDWMPKANHGENRYSAIFALQLLASGDEEAVVQLFAASYLVPQDFDGAPWVFPPKPGGERGRRYANLEISRMKEDVEFLDDHHLAGRVMDAIQRNGQPESFESLTLRMVATPERATFEKFALPQLALLDPGGRSRVLQAWDRMFARRPAQAELRVRLIEELLDQHQPEQAAYYQLGETILDAARMPNPSGLMAKAWKRLEPEARAKDPNAPNATESTMRVIFPAMLSAADDAVWESYWKLREADGEPLLRQGNWPGLGDMVEGVAPARLRQVLPRIVREAKDPEINRFGPVWIGAVLESGDPDLLRQAKASLPAGGENSAQYAALCDLALGEVDGLSPYIGGFVGDDGELTVWWNLVTVPNERDSRVPGIPVAAFPKLDGKFELQILGGDSPDKLSALETVRAAPACGSLRLKPGKEVQHLGLLVTQPGGGIVRWAPTVGRRPSLKGMQSVDVSGEVLEKKGFVKWDRNGPGGIPAWRIRTAGGSATELADFPWDGSGEVRVRGWFTGSCELGLCCYDASGKLIHTIRLNHDLSQLPIWQLLEKDLPKEEGLPAATVRIALVVGDPEESGERSRSLAVSGLKLAAGGEMPMPEGFRKLTRVPGRGNSIDLDAEGKRLAIGMGDSRVAVVEIASGRTDLIQTALVPNTDDGGLSGITRIAWAGANLFAADRIGTVYRIDPQAKKARTLPVGSSRGSVNAGSTLCASRDGKWVAWLKNNQTLAIMAAEGGPVREIEVAKVYRLSAGEEGLRISCNDGTRYSLKSADLAAGQPEPADPLSNWGEERRPQGPTWRNLELSSHQPASRKRTDDGEDRISVPTDHCFVISGDDTLYYADKQGVVVAVKP